MATRLESEMFTYEQRIASLREDASLEGTKITRES